MKRNILAYIFITAGALGSCSQLSAEERHPFAVRLKGNFALGNAYKTEYNFPVSDSSNSQTSFGLEVGYTFLSRGAHSLEAGLGFYIAPTTFKTEIESVRYNYSASSDADMDGNQYERYVELTDLAQTNKLTRFQLPVFVKYDYRFHERFSVYGKAGLLFGFGGKVKIDKTEGLASGYGIFPEYGDLMMDNDWLDEFGTRPLNTMGKPEGKSANADVGLLVGAGVSVSVTSQIGVTVGLNYATGFSDMYKDGRLMMSDEGGKDVLLPVTYTVVEGQVCRSLTEGLKKARLSRLGIDVGVEFRF